MPTPSPLASEMSSEEGGDSSDEEGYPGEAEGPPPPKRVRAMVVVEEFCCTYNNMRWKLKNGRAGPVLEFKDVSLNTSYLYS